MKVVCDAVNVSACGIFHLHLIILYDYGCKMLTDDDDDEDDDGDDNDDDDT